MTGFDSEVMIFNNVYGIMIFERRYRQKVVSDRKEEFQTYAVHISDDVNDSHETIHEAWIMACLNWLC